MNPGGPGGPCGPPCAMPGWLLKTGGPPDAPGPGPPPGIPCPLPPPAMKVPRPPRPRPRGPCMAAPGLQACCELWGLLRERCLISLC
eukprot:1162118-Pelagomonas_calceolata.AAC.6